MKPLRVAVVGAGIGGLTAALALASRGHHVTVFERRTGFGEPGAGIQLSPNASRILIELGLEMALRRLATEPDRIVVRDLRSGREIGAVRLGAFAAERFGAPYWFVARQDLHTSLLDAVRGQAHARLRIGRSFSTLSQTGDAARLSVEGTGGNAEEIEADLVVGADGLWSRVRASLGDGRDPANSGHVAYRATLPRAAVPADLAGNEGGLWLAPDRHLVHYPIGAGRLVNLVGVSRRAERLNDWSSPVEPWRVSEIFAGAAKPVRGLVAAAEEWSAWSLHELPARTMTRGRIALLGDAAHPALPFLAQGGAMAIEDAASLALAVTRAGEDVPRALRGYEAERIGRVRRMQAAARRNGRVYHGSGLLALGRNLVMRRLGPEGMTERMSWVYGWRPGAA